MAFSTVPLNADTLSLLTQLGQTVTLAAPSVTTTTAAGDETHGWASVTTCRAQIQPPQTWRGRDAATLNVEGVQRNVRRIAILEAVSGITDNQRLYVGGAVTTTAEHWWVGRADEFPGHWELYLLEKGPREP